MYTHIQIVFDAAEPARIAEFWGFALGYVTEPPPPGFATWEDFARSIGMPEEEFGDQSALIDPEGAGPRIFIQRVAEPKTVKNRLHLDVRVAGREVRGAEREQMIEKRVQELLDRGATFAWRNSGLRGYSVVLRDPEGNEFCVS